MSTVIWTAGDYQQTVEELDQSHRCEPVTLVDLVEVLEACCDELNLARRISHELADLGLASGNQAACRLAVLHDGCRKLTDAFADLSDKLDRAVGGA